MQKLVRLAPVTDSVAIPWLRTVDIEVREHNLQEEGADVQLVLLITGDQGKAFQSVHKVARTAWLERGRTFLITCNSAGLTVNQIDCVKLKTDLGGIFQGKQTWR